MVTIGILALQGDYEKHVQVVEKLNHKSLLVKTRDQLNQCDRLIIPGGESTTFLNLIERLELRDALLDFGHNKFIMGTCAGLIILAREIVDLPYKPLGLIDIAVKRNAYGKQIDSFIDDVELNLNGNTASVEGVFIRAPKIMGIGKRVRVLGKHKDDIAIVANKNILVTTMHPELTDNLCIHQYFIEMMNS